MDDIEYEITAEDLESYRNNMLENEKSTATIEKYIRDILAFCRWNHNQSINRIQILEWKQYLVSLYAVSSVNSMLAALNGYFRFKGWEQLRVKPVRQQKQLYRETERDISRCEYMQLLQEAGKCGDERLKLVMETIWRVKPVRQQKQLYRETERDISRCEYMQLLQEAGKCGDERLKLVMETICSTGIRISELPFITAEAVFHGKAFVNCKNKKRIIFIPTKLQSLLKKYMKKHHISSGPVFLTRNGTVLNRSNIWRSMKRLCKRAGIDCKKVFPHNLRHLFAKTFYNTGKDLAKLADVLGHSRIETTRIYVMENGREHERMIEMLGLTEDCIPPILRGRQQKRKKSLINDS